MGILSKSLFPHVLVILASAGTGKTHDLSKRITEYLLAENSEVPYNDLRNILAITFTVNASREMKGRVLNWLKGLYLGEQKVINLFEISEERLRNYSNKSGELINKILSNYKDFQIKTIDSFLTTIFKASSISFGFTPNFEIIFDNREYLETAFDLYLDELRDFDNPFFEVLKFINENEPYFSFTPYKKIFENVIKLYQKERHYPEGFKNIDREKEWIKIKDNLKSLSKEISKFIEDNNLSDVIQKDGLMTMLSDLEREDFESFFTRGEKKHPIKKSAQEEPWAKKLDYYWNLLKSKRNEALFIYAENYFYPYLKVLRSFEEKIEFVKRAENVVFIEDIPKIILDNLNINNIPDIYIRLGGKLYHFFIDEFQDTSPIQWENLKLLIENSLAGCGSLYVVGDTKQAIYGFRDTDYRIMKKLYERCKEEEFLRSVGDKYFTRHLDKNYRSGEFILKYVKNIFENARDRYIDYGESGLFGDWSIEVEKIDRGYVNARIVYNEKNNEETKEKEEVLKILDNCIKRGYTFRDITILANKNKHIVEISSWLNNANIPFISYSSLDIRKRKVIRELIYLLKFLDAPKDNLSLSMFLLGDIFAKIADKEKIKEFLFNKKNSNFLYKDFEKEFPHLWDTYFDKPFKYVGYLPLYELLCFLIRGFKVKDNFNDESGAIAKLLEVIKDLEGKGKNSLKEFLDFVQNKVENEYESLNVFELSIPENFDGVKLMTVHKAKGLSAKVLIYVVYPLNNTMDSLKIYEDDESQSITVLKINKKFVPLQDKYKEIERKGKINDLNSFYVGLTRAEEELYIIGIGEDKGKNEREEKRYHKSFPVDLILEGEFGKKPGIIEKEKCIKDDQESVELVLSDNINIHSLAYTKLNVEERRRGEYIHLILSEVYTSEDFKKVPEITKKFNYIYKEFDIVEVSNEVLEFINHKNIKPFFDVHKEQVSLEKNFVDEHGLLRIDRLIFYDNEVIIVDFKTKSWERSDKKQLERYAKAIKEIYNKKVSCYILLIDNKEVIRVYEC